MENTFTPENLKKQFRLSEFLAEKIISSIAYLSIAIILLIFFFVFRESLPIFSAKPEVKTEQSATTDVAKPEAYSSEEAESLVPETYGEATENLTESDTDAPESYGGVEKEDLTETEEKNSLEPESYGGVTTESLVETDSENVNANNLDTATTTKNPFATFLGTQWVPVSDNPRYGLIPLFIGTLKVTIISILFAAPIAILAALYTSTFASKRRKEYIKPIIELLAAFPSVVIGFFALMVLASFVQTIFGNETRLNSFVGGIAMALAAIPIIYTITEDALSSVPKTYTEASLALGASKWQTAFFVVLPAAVPGIFAAILLGIGRVFGETMIALMATGNAAINSLNPMDSVRTFAATIGSEMAETVFGDTHYSVLFFIGSVLFIFSFGLNALAEFYVKGRLIKKIQGK
ncbi:phosphate ABC transporter permease subunit PstC [Flavobacterium sp.]|uniref:phosphate ABC transporter permease subunit PstC n=1 Tax=Flavobacterium sp. TaxID=239 RepID=UPI003D138621